MRDELTPSIAWRDDERAAFGAEAGERPAGLPSDADVSSWRALADSAAERGDTATLRSVLLFGPREVARDAASREQPVAWYALNLKPIISRLELDAAPLIRRALRETTDALGAALPLGDPALALAMAMSLGPSSKKWLERHPRAAARGLSSLVVHPNPKQRAAAWAAITLLCEHGHRELVLSEARAMGAHTPALAHGLSRWPLAHSRLPDTLGFDDRGTIILDYGARSFELFVHAGELRIRDQHKRTLRSLPSRRAGDCERRSRLARDQLALLRVQIRQLIEGEIDRWERAMVRGVQQPLSDLRRLAGHPVLREYARALLWVPRADPARAFRIDESGGFVDADERPVQVDARAQVSIAHPADLDARELLRWADLFSDYEIIQPFEQVRREVFRSQELGSDLAKAVAGADTVRLAELVRRGWTATSRIGAKVETAARSHPFCSVRLSADGELLVTSGSLKHLSVREVSELLRDLASIRRVED